MWYQPFLGEKLTKQELEQMMSEADSNGDGKIDYAGRYSFSQILPIWPIWCFRIRQGEYIAPAF